MNAAILVAALGYFVDVYDLILFSVVRVPSLKALGLEGEELLSHGVLLLNSQMFGILLGGLIWGIWGDKRGRISVLFGSILLYSSANIANGFVQTIDQYVVIRFLAGLGLAGELGAGITLVSELMSKETRGWGTTFVATIGVMGAVAAALIGDLFDWRTAYFIGGGLGMLLLVARVAVHESGMFQQTQKRSIARGDFSLLLRSRDRFMRYLRCILIGLPIWYVVGIIVTFAPEMGTGLGMQELPTPGKAVLYSYLGFVVGDLASGIVSQLLKSRKKALLIFIIITAVMTVITLTRTAPSLTYFYTLCIGLGVGAGYWAVIISASAEQFGTNLRATATTTVPNFIRGAIIPITILFNHLKLSIGVIESALFVGLGCFVIALAGLWFQSETFGRDLDFIEE